MNLGFLEGIGELMRREGLEELLVRDGERLLRIRRAGGGGSVCGEGAEASEINAPLTGILLLRPSAEGRPCVAPGSRKRRGETLFYIEAMKHLNEVCAPRSLTVLEVLAEDRQSVEEGAPVLRVSWEEER